MFFTRRPLLPGEPNYELWLARLIPAAWASAWFLLFQSDFRLPPCPLRTFTGVPCPGCGCTRATLALGGGHFAEAFLFNPLWAAACVAGVVVWFYSLGVVFLKTPRFRDDSGRFFSSGIFRVAVVSAVAVNWAWVIYYHFH